MKKLLLPILLMVLAFSFTTITATTITALTTKQKAFINKESRRIAKETNTDFKTVKKEYTRKFLKARAKARRGR